MKKRLLYLIIFLNIALMSIQYADGFDVGTALQLIEKGYTAIDNINKDSQKIHEYMLYLKEFQSNVEKSMNYYSNGQYPIALIYINRALETNETAQNDFQLDEDSKELALFIRSIILIKLNRYQEANRDIDEVLRINPEDATAWNQKGMILNLVGSYSDAITCFDTAIYLDPQNSSTYLSNKNWALQRLNPTPISPSLSNYLNRPQIA